MRGQKRLKAARVLCVGTGGLGSPLLMYLAAAGVGRIGIVDMDVVDESNLQRQIIHGTASVGRAKVLSAKERIHDINPLIQVDVFEEFLVADNALEILADYDVIVDGTDNFPTRYLVNDACEVLGKPNVYGSVFAFEGQASVFNYKDGPTYRDLYPEPPPPGMVPNCAEGGILGVVPGIIGLIQATETIKIILDLGKTLSGRILLYDATTMTFREVKLKKRPNAQPVTELIDYQQFCGIQSKVGENSRGNFARISVREARTRMDEGWKPFVLDVRDPFEIEIASLEFTNQVCPHNDVKDILDQLPRDRDILVFCKAGARSAEVCAVLASVGLNSVINLDGGILSWAREIDPELPTY